VVGKDQPVQAVPGALADLIDDAVLAVAAVLGVDVVIAGQPQETAAPAAAGGGGVRGDGRAGARALAEVARGQQTGAAGLRDASAPPVEDRGET
jgi:hypothetical protein